MLSMLRVLSLRRGGALVSVGNADIAADSFLRFDALLTKRGLETFGSFSLPLGAFALGVCPLLGALVRVVRALVRLLRTFTRLLRAFGVAKRPTFAAARKGRGSGSSAS